MPTISVSKPPPSPPIHSAGGSASSRDPQWWRSFLLLWLALFLQFSGGVLLILSLMQFQNETQASLLQMVCILDPFLAFCALCMAIMFAYIQRRQIDDRRPMMEVRRRPLRGYLLRIGISIAAAVVWLTGFFGVSHVNLTLLATAIAADLLAIPAINGCSGRRLFPGKSQSPAKRYDAELNARETRLHRLVRNTRLHYSGERRKVVFALPMDSRILLQAALLACVAIMGGLSAWLAISLMGLSGLTIDSSAMIVLICRFVAIAFCLVMLSGVLVDARGALLRRLDVDLPTRTYRQRQVEREDIVPVATRWLPRWKWKSITLSGALEEAGLRGLAVQSTYIGLPRYAVVLAWRDARHPTALLSQWYFSRSDAESSLRDLTALLDLPAVEH